MGIRAYSISGLSQGTPLAISATAASFTIVDNYDYLFWSDVDCYIKLGPANMAPVTVDTGFLIRTGVRPVPFHVTANTTVSVIAATGTGTFRHHKVGIVI